MHPAAAHRLEQADVGVGDGVLLRLLDEPLGAQLAAGAQRHHRLRAAGRASRSASSWVSATTALTVRKVRGSASASEGWNCDR